jgi:hypothetical protein
VVVVDITLFTMCSYKLYGEAQFAQKAAGLELHGLNAIMNARCAGNNHTQMSNN